MLKMDPPEQEHYKTINGTLIQMMDHANQKQQENGQIIPAGEDSMA